MGKKSIKSLRKEKVNKVKNKVGKKYSPGTEVLDRVRKEEFIRVEDPDDMENSNHNKKKGSIKRYCS